MQIKAKYAEVTQAAGELDQMVDEYNRDCSDVCLDGFVKCADGDEHLCIPACDCCTAHNLVCCDSGNGVQDTTDLALGNDTLYCYEYCCAADEMRCNGECVPTTQPPSGTGNPYDY